MPDQSNMTALCTDVGKLVIFIPGYQCTFLFCGKVTFRRFFFYRLRSLDIHKKESQPKRGIP